MLLVRRLEGVGGPQWALPGTFLHQGERLADAVTRSLTQKAGVTGGHPAQLAVFDDPGRDERGWVLSVAHLAVIPYAALVDAVLADPNRAGWPRSPGRVPCPTTTEPSWLPLLENYDDGMPTAPTPNVY